MKYLEDLLVIFRINTVMICLTKLNSSSLNTAATVWMIPFGLSGAVR